MSLSLRNKTPALSAKKTTDFVMELAPLKGVLKRVPVQCGDEMCALQENINKSNFSKQKIAYKSQEKGKATIFVMDLIPAKHEH